MKKVLVFFVLSIILISCTSAQQNSIKITYMDSLEVIQTNDLDLYNNNLSLDRSLVKDIAESPFENFPGGLDVKSSYFGVGLIIKDFQLPEFEIDGNIPLYSFINIEYKTLKLNFLKIGKERYFLFVIDYSEEILGYPSSLIIGEDKSILIDRIGEPNFYTDSLLIYEYKSYYQINIYIDEFSKTERIRLISWWGT